MLTERQIKLRDEIRVFLKRKTVERLKEFEGEEVEKGGIIFLGDSLTQRFELKEHFADINCINRGIGGDTTDGVLHRLDGVKKLEPSQIILLIGTNDLGNEFKEPQEVIDGMEKLIIALKDYNLVLEYLYPINDNYDVEQTNEQINEVNEGIKNLADKYELDTIDLRFILTNNEKLLDVNYTGDGLHINKLAYKVISNEIKKQLGWI